MKILITGAHGQLGQDITNICKKKGHITFPYGSMDLNITKYQMVFNEITEKKPEVIINCAAYNAVDQAETDWEQAYEVNGIGPKHLALAASAAGAILIHYSTDYVFDGETTRPYTIADNPVPINRYGESKFLGEQMVMRHAQKYYLIRVSWVFGKGNTNFVKKVIEWSSQRDQITVVDDQTSSPTYTWDLAQASLDLLKTGQYGLYHMTNTGYCSRFEWAEYILKQVGWTGNLIVGKSSEFQTPATRPAFSPLDPFATKQTIGYDLPTWQDATDRFLQEIRRM